MSLFYVGLSEPGIWPQLSHLTLFKDWLPLKIIGTAPATKGLPCRQEKPRERAR